MEQKVMKNIRAVGCGMAIGFAFLLWTHTVSSVTKADITKELNAVHTEEVNELRSQLNSTNLLLFERTQAVLELTEEVKRLRSAPAVYEVSTSEFVVTAYSPYDDQNGINADSTPDSTATGTKPKYGTFAVDPKVIPYGSTVIIMYTDGTTEVGKAEDTGGAIKGNRLDVFRQTYKSAMKFGRREAKVIWYAAK